MLPPVALADDFNRLERSLPDDWAEVRLVLTVADDGRCDRAAALLGPLNPGRRGRTLRFTTGRRGRGIGPEAVRRLLRRLDEDAIAGELQLAGVQEAPEEQLRPVRSLREEWERAVAGLPVDWSDLYAEVQLDSSDYLERGALLLAPLNPARHGVSTLRFRCAQRFGYGVSPGMAARCLERCDEEGITGTVRILHALSDTYPVATQGPVWYSGGHVI